MSFEIRDVTDRDLWDAFVSSRPDANFLQSWDFYEFHAARGKKVVRRAVFDGSGQIVAAYAGVVETARRGRYLAIAGGPLIKTPDSKIPDAKSPDSKTPDSSSLMPGTLPDKDLTRLIIDDIKKVAKENHCVFARVRPQWERTPESLAFLESLGLTPAPMFLSVEYAALLDLRLSEEEILKNASQGFRRKLRKAEKADLEITADASDASIQAFCELEGKHAARQGYVAFSSDFLTKQFEAFKRHDEILIYTAKSKDTGEILAQNFIIFYGPEASYHYGVSSEAGTRLSSAPLLHLKAMEEARKRGCLRYNLWGIVEKDEASHRFYGVSEFKRSFGGSEYKYIPAHDLVIDPLKYQITRLVESARKKHRHL